VDLDILFRTLLVLLPRFARAAPDVEELLFGPVQRFIRRHLSWFILDLFLSAATVFSAGLAWWWVIRSFRPTWTIGLGSAVAMVLTYTLMNQIWGLQRHSWSCASGREVADIALSVTCSTALLTVFSMLGLGAPKKLILLSGVLAFGAFTAARYRSRLVTVVLGRWHVLWERECPSQEKRLLIVGTGGLGQFCARQVGYRLKGQHYRVVGFVDDDLHKRGIRVRGIPVLGSSRTLPSVIVRHNIDMVVLADPYFGQDRWQAILENCQHLPVQFRVVPDLLEFVSEPE
jgi:FlaA1/EpsC-like NDP-sugar epimerase